MEYFGPTSRPAAAAGLHSPAPDLFTQEPQQHVGALPDRLSGIADTAVRESMTDAEREDAIRRAGKAMEHHMALYAASSNLADRGDADRARLLMQRLIAGRSAAQVAKLEKERGLA